MLQLLKRYRELILVAVLLLVPLGIFFARAKKPAERSAVDRAVVWATSPVEKAVAWAVTGVLQGWSGYVALRGSHERAHELTRELTQLRIERQQLLQEQAEAERLRGLLGFAAADPERKYMGARVVGVQLSPSGLQLLVIDRGAEDGVDRDKPVVTAEGVVGRVYAATAHSAEVLTLTDRNSSIAVRVDRTRARANVRGLGAPGACRLDYALRAEDVIEGDLLVTSGTDAVFPRGIPVGNVSELKRAAAGLFQEATVTPTVNVTRVEEVLVITSFEAPAPEVLPAATTSSAPAKGVAPAAAAKGAAPAAPAKGATPAGGPKPATAKPPAAAKPSDPAAKAAAPAPKPSPPGDPPPPPTVQPSDAGAKSPP